MIDSGVVLPWQECIFYWAENVCICFVKQKKKIVWKAKDFLFVEEKIPSRYFQYIFSQYFIYILTWQTTNVFKEAEREPGKSLGDEKRQEWWIWVKLMGGFFWREIWVSKKSEFPRSLTTSARKLFSIAWSLSPRLKSAVTFHLIFWLAKINLMVKEPCKDHETQVSAMVLPGLRLFPLWQKGIFEIQPLTQNSHLKNRNRR